MWKCYPLIPTLCGNWVKFDTTVYGATMHLCSSTFTTVSYLHTERYKLFTPGNIYCLNTYCFNVMMYL